MRILLLAGKDPISLNPILSGWLKYCVLDANCNGDVKKQYEQLDLTYILNDLLEIFQGRRAEDGTLLEAWTRAAFHSGIPGLASLLKSKNPTTILPEIREVRDAADQKFRDGFRLESLTEWYSMLTDIYDGWQAKRDQDGWQPPWAVAGDPEDLGTQ